MRDGHLDTSQSMIAAKVEARERGTIGAMLTPHRVMFITARF